MTCRGERGSVVLPVEVHPGDVSVVNMAASCGGVVLLVVVVLLCWRRVAGGDVAAVVVDSG